jgi:uncharacterized RDD family membrane protein YckC
VIRYAAPARRFWAAVVSVLVDLVVLGAMRAVIGGGDVGAPFAVWLLIHHVGLVTEGGTLGQRLLGVRVVTVDGERVGVLMAFVRIVALVGLAIPPLGLGVLWMLDQPQRRGWHDLLAGTVVVREVGVLQQAAPDWADDPPWLRPKPAREPVAPAVPGAMPPPAADAPADGA